MRTFLASARAAARLLCAAVLLANLAPATAHADEAPAPPVIGAYYPGYKAAEYPVARIPADKITHLFYAFARIEHGACAVEPDAPGHFADLAELKRKHPSLRTLISIGGWEADGFSDAARTRGSRKRFVASCMAIFFAPQLDAFDGVDIDWEFPVYGGPSTVTARAQDRHNLTLLAREFRRSLDALGQERGRPYLLTAALPAGRLQSSGPYDPALSFELQPLADTLDFINLMTYDMGTAFDGVASFNAPLREVPEDPLDPQVRRWNSVEGGIAYYRQQGVPAQKLVLGVPFYGRGFRVTSDANHGLYQPYSDLFDPGDWRSIKAKLLDDPKWQHHWHPVAQTPWLFNSDDRIFVSYEDTRSIAIRAKLAKDSGLRGVFTWELTGDDDQHSLLEAMARFRTGEGRVPP
jgi:chitinase